MPNSLQLVPQNLRRRSFHKSLILLQTGSIGTSLRILRNTLGMETHFLKRGLLLQHNGDTKISIGVCKFIQVKLLLLPVLYRLQRKL